MIHWLDMKREIPQEIIAGQPNEVEMTIPLINGARISLKGCEDPDSLRGQKLRFLGVDEVASIRNWDTVWEEALRPSLTDYKAPALFISTPKGYNHFYNLYLKEQTDEDYKSWTFTSYDNPFIPKEEIDKASKELSEEAFGQEYLAQFKKLTGAVYKDFDRQKHVIDPVELQFNWTYYRAIDFGWAHPTATVFVAISDKGVIYVFDEIYLTGLQTPDLVSLIKQKSGTRMFTQTIADSAQASDIAEINRYGLSVIPVQKESKDSTVDWTTYRIRKVSEKLKNNKLFIFRNCENLIYEFENYKMSEVNDNGLLREVPMKINDHALDALSYLIISLPEVVVPVFNNTTFTRNDFSKWRQ